MLTIYHNGRCKQSFAGLQYLQDNNIEHKVIEYLKTHIPKDQLKGVLEKLNMKPIDIVRTEKKMYEDNYKGKDISDDEWIDILIEHPRLMKRPIVVSETKAVLAIPPEKIQDLL